MKVVYPENCLWSYKKQSTEASLIEKRIILLIGKEKAGRIDELVFDNEKDEVCENYFEASELDKKHYKIVLDESYLFNLIRSGDGRNRFDSIILNFEGLT